MSETKTTKAEKLLAHVEQFIKAQHIYCGETVYQSDRVIENAYEFITGCCEIVGYLRDEEDDDENLRAAAEGQA